MMMTITTDLRHLVTGAVLLLAGLVAAGVWLAAPAASQTGAPAQVDRFAFVARADNPVDALAAASVAGQLGAPVYLTFPGGLDEPAAQGLAATAPEVVVLAGGTVALSDQVEADVAALLPDARIIRKAGFDRIETARLINELAGEIGIGRPVLAGATTAGDVGINGTLTVDGTDIGAALAALTDRIDTLASDNATLRADLEAATGRVGELEATLTGVTRSGDVLTFAGMNVQVTNGAGVTASTNGLGNLIVGYGEDHTNNACQPSNANCDYQGDSTVDNRSGSHNLVIGVDHTYTRYGGLVAGQNNTISGIFASVSGGRSNTASGIRASVSGGFANTASGSSAWVSGGVANTASSNFASVSGGSFNTASGSSASVSGGDSNTASSTATSVAGGRNGTVSDAFDSRIGNQDYADG